MSQPSKLPKEAYYTLVNDALTSIADELEKIEEMCPEAINEAMTVFFVHQILNYSSMIEGDVYRQIDFCTEVKTQIDETIDRVLRNFNNSLNHYSLH